MDTVRAAAKASFGGIVRVKSFIADCSTVFIFLYIFIVRAVAILGDIVFKVSLGALITKRSNFTGKAFSRAVSTNRVKVSKLINSTFFRAGSRGAANKEFSKARVRRIQRSWIFNTPIGIRRPGIRGGARAGRGRGCNSKSIVGCKAQIAR